MLWSHEIGPIGRGPAVEASQGGARGAAAAAVVALAALASGCAESAAADAGRATGDAEHEQGAQAPSDAAAEAGGAMDATAGEDATAGDGIVDGAPGHDVGPDASLPGTDSLLELEVVRTLPAGRYSEGLDFHDGLLWQATPREILKLDPSNGTILGSYEPAPAVGSNGLRWSEGITWLAGRLYNATYVSPELWAGAPGETGFAWSTIGSLAGEGCAFGLTHDGSSLIASGCFSNRLHFIDPASGATVGTVDVQPGPGGQQVFLEDLAWDGGSLWASDYNQRNRLLRIDAATGTVLATYRLAGCDDILDGIALGGAEMYVTGKSCPILVARRPMP